MKNIKLLPDDFSQHRGIYATAVFLAVIGVVFVLSYTPILNQPIAVSNYDECTKLASSTIQESYPTVCVTEDGQRFVQPTPTQLAPTQSSPSATGGSTGM